MGVSGEDFRQGMRRLGGAVNIVSTACDGVWAGLTATAVCSLSAEPPRLLACINRLGATYENLSKGRNMCVNVLTRQHEALAMKFAGMDGAQETDRFDEALWETGQSSAPRLKTALASFDCRIESILDSGSHGIVIGRIIDISLDEGSVQEPLFYIDGAFVTLGSGP